MGTDYLANIKQALAQIEQLSLTPDDIQDNIDAINSLHAYIREQFAAWANSGGTLGSQELIDGIITMLNGHISNMNNPHAVTAMQIGLGNVANLAPEDLPMSDATKIYVDGLSFDMSTHIADIDNPHEVTAVQIGFNFDSTSGTFTFTDPTTGNTYNIGSADTISVNEQALANHLADTDNPHQVTAAQVGLGNVANLAPADLPVSTATQSAITTAQTTVQGNLDTHIGDVSNPHAVTAAQVGLGAYPTNPMDLPVSTAVNNFVQPLGSGLSNHTNNFNNPHQVTAAQVGLGNVQNLAPSDMPVSNAVNLLIQNLNTQVSANTGNISTNTTDILNNTNELMTQRGLINTLQYAVNNLSLGGLGFGGIFATTGDVTSPVNGNLYVIGTSPNYSLQIYYNGTWTILNQQFALDMDQFVLQTAFQDLVNTVNNMTVQMTTNANTIAANATTMTNHIGDNNNPHGVTAAQVGLGNVQNLSPNDMPISIAQGSINTSVQNSLTDINNTIGTLAPINNPTFTGVVTIPGGAVIPGFAPIDSPVFTTQVTLPNTVIGGNFSLARRVFSNGDTWFQLAFPVNFDSGMASLVNLVNPVPIVNSNNVSAITVSRNFGFTPDRDNMRALVMAHENTVNANSDLVMSSFQAGTPTYNRPATDKMVIYDSQEDRPMTMTLQSINTSDFSQPFGAVVRFNTGSSLLEYMFGTSGQIMSRNITNPANPPAFATSPVLLTFTSTTFTTTSTSHQVNLTITVRVGPSGIRTARFSFVSTAAINLPANTTLNIVFPLSTTFGNPPIGQFMGAFAANFVTAPITQIMSEVRINRTTLTGAWTSHLTISNPTVNPINVQAGTWEATMVML